MSDPTATSAPVPVPASKRRTYLRPVPSDHNAVMRWLGADGKRAALLPGLFVLNGEKVRQARERALLRQCDLGARLSVGAATVCTMEKSQRAVNEYQARRIVVALGYPAEAWHTFVLGANREERPTERAS